MLLGLAVTLGGIGFGVVGIVFITTGKAVCVVASGSDIGYAVVQSLQTMTGPLPLPLTMLERARLVGLCRGLAVIIFLN